jgi:nucleoside-triphosphatase THEP1
MPETGIYILTAPVQSGKTTSLLQWCNGHSEVYGILTPVMGGKRVFMNVHTGEQFRMEAINEEESLSIGRFVFGKKNFDKASQVIRDTIHKPGWLIIDEIGPLELRDEGFAGVLKQVLEARTENILLVIRESLADKIKKHFRIESITVITRIDLF